MTADDLTGERILDAALAELAEHGLRRFATEDVARRAGLNRITIYRRFPSKDALLRAVILREGERLFTAVDRAIAAVDTPEERVVEGFVAGLRVVRDHAVVQRVLRNEPEVLGSLVVEHGEAVVAAATDYLLGFLKRPVEVELMVRLCLSFVVIPTKRIGLDTDAKARTFARRHLAPAAKVAR